MDVVVASVVVDSAMTEVSDWELGLWRLSPLEQATRARVADAARRIRRFMVPFVVLGV
jgi:hypothetical protein